MTFYSNPIPNPSLVEPGMKYFIDKTLKNCHKVRFEYSNFIHNLLLFLILMLVFYKNIPNYNNMILEIDVDKFYS